MATNLDNVTPETLQEIKSVDPELYEMLIKTRSARDRERAVRLRRAGQVGLGLLGGQAPLADIPDSSGLTPEKLEELNLKYTELMQTVEKNKQTFVENYLDTNKSAADKVLDTTKGFQAVLKQMIASEGSVQGANAAASASVQVQRLQSLDKALDRQQKAAERYSMTMAQDFTQDTFRDLLSTNIRNPDGSADIGAMSSAFQILQQGASIGDAEERNRFMYAANSWAKGQGFTDLQHMAQEYAGNDGVAAPQNQLDVVRQIRDAYAEIPRIDQEMMSIQQQTQGEIDALTPYMNKGAGASLNFGKVFDAYKKAFGSLDTLDPGAQLRALGIKPTGEAADDARILADEMFRPAEGQIRQNLDRLNTPQGPVTYREMKAATAEQLHEKGYEAENANRAQRRLINEAGPASKGSFEDLATRTAAGVRRDRGQSSVPQKLDPANAVPEQLDAPINIGDAEKSDPQAMTDARQKSTQELLDLDLKNKTDKLMELLNTKQGVV